MAIDSSTIEVLTILFLSLVSAAVAAIVSEEAEEEEEDDLAERADKPLAFMAAFKRARKRARRHDDETPPRKRVRYDYESAYQCAMRDYIGPCPLYARQFEGIFRITRTIFERILQTVGNMDPYFTRRQMIGGDWGIYPEVKVMMALKQLAFGCAPSAFVDYFQMGRTSGQNCVKNLCKLIASSPLREEYLRNYTKADAKRVSAMHEAEFGVAGCLGCLDCMHVFSAVGSQQSLNLLLKGIGEMNT